MAQITDSRKKKIESYVDIKNSLTLEIGALDSPTYNPKDHHIKFLDFTSKEELATKGDHNPRYKLENLVNVDYVCPTTEYSKYIQDRFDLVIANHVIEHIPDTIRWLDEIYNILSSGGYLFLSVPDKRYTFDIARRNTTIIDLLRNNEEQVVRPSFYNILEHFYYHKSVSSKDAWNNNYKEKINTKRFSLNKAIDVARKHSMENYADVHCHVYTSSSFFELIDELDEINKINLNLIDIDEPSFMTNEFHVVLRKPKSHSPANEHKRTTITKIKEKSNPNIIDANGYEFVDFGCSGGGSLERYGKMFQAEGKGLGLDINPEKIKLTTEKGFDAIACDITKIQLNANVRFGIMHHFLEHIPNIQDVNEIVKKACTIVDDFLLIRQPYYDADPYLFEHGLKLFWSNWRGHPNHMTQLEFHNMLMPMVSDGQIMNFSLYGLHPVTSSQDPNIHNLDSEIDQHEWKADKHSNKKNIDFTVPIYKELVAIVDISGNATNRIESILNPHEKFFSSNHGVTR